MQSVHWKDSATLEGGKYDAVKVSGMGRCMGDLEARAMTVDGSLRCEKNVQAGSLVVGGVANFEQGLKADTLYVDGSLGAAGSIEARDIDCGGVLRIEGDITARQLTAQGAVHAAHIQAENVEIQTFRGTLGRQAPRGQSQVDEVQAGTLKLAGVKVRRAEGVMVWLGPGCEVEELHCTGVLYLHPAAHVGRVLGGGMQQSWE